MAVKSILMVCRGNICRSPMAEGFFTHQLTKIQSPITVSSAGISALVEHPADESALAVMNKNSIDLSSHRARQLSETIVKKADLILVMTHSHLKTIAGQYLSAKGKTFLLGCWQRFEINDPYQLNTAAFEKVYQQIELAWQDWKSRILTCQTCV